MNPDQELREVSIRVAEVLVHVRAHTRQLNQHGKQIVRLDERADAQGAAIAQVAHDMAGMGEFSKRLAALEKWRYTIAGAYVCAGIVASYLVQWVHP